MKAEGQKEMTGKDKTRIETIDFPFTCLKTRIKKQQFLFQFRSPPEQNFLPVQGALTVLLDKEKYVKLKITFR